MALIVICLLIAFKSKESTKKHILLYNLAEGYYDTNGIHSVIVENNYVSFMKREHNIQNDIVR